MRGDQIGGPIRWRMHIGAPRTQVFELLATDAGRAAFWAESAVEKDGFVNFRFINGYECESKILQSDPPSLFMLDYIGGRARFELRADGAGGTDLLLVHEGIEAAEWNEVHAGWLNVLFPLKARAMHDIDLRNHDPSRSWDQGYADQ